MKIQFLERIHKIHKVLAMVTKEIKKRRTKSLISEMKKKSVSVLLQISLILKRIKESYELSMFTNLITKMK